MRILPIALLATLAIAAPAKAADLSPLQPPAGNTVFDAGYATGVQIYSCNNGAWSLKAPRATLKNIFGQSAWTHFAGPTWQYKDGSAVVGQAVGNVTVTSNSIPRLLVKKGPTTPAYLAKHT